MVPPPQAMDTDTKGRIVVEAYYIADQGFKYIETPNNVSDKMNPIDIDDRDFLINQYERAEKERGFMLSQYVPLIATISVLLILSICFIVFFGEIAQPFLEAQDNGIETIELQKQKMEIEKEIIYKLDEIINDKQREQLDEG
jgi:competence protein ComGC